MEHGRKQSFNTSHVTLYRWDSIQDWSWKHVSIHHMLLFIGFTLIGAICTRGFNTSHVTLYPPSPKGGVGVGVFQYITCYSLSKLQSYSTSESEGFNTSHVTLYLSTKTVEKSKTLFQYITCYSLSLVYNDCVPSGNMFQYITCYSLSLVL